MSKPRAHRIAAGIYQTANGDLIKKIEANHGYPEAWFLTLAGDFRPVEVYPTLRQALDAIPFHTEETE